MKIIADYHTHTTYSHGKGSVMDNALTAKERGLTEIAISDHGFSHPFFGIRRRRVDDLVADCRRASEETGVGVLVGIESNFIDRQGRCDLREEDYDKFDVFLAGAHVCVAYRDFETMWNLAVSSPSKKKRGGLADKRQVVRTTDMYINAVKGQPIDVITHLGYKTFPDVRAVCEACRDVGTYVEINTKKTHLSDEEWAVAVDTGVNFVVGSDAHSVERIADFDCAMALIERVGIPLERVHNLDRLPDFRFARYKGEKR